MEILEVPTCTRTEDSMLWILGYFPPVKKILYLCVQKCSSRGHAGIGHVLLIRYRS